MADKSLFDQNITSFKIAFGEKRFNDLDWDYINKKIKNSDPQKDYESWKVSSDKAILMPDLLPRSRKLMDYYLDMAKQYNIGDPINQYINDHECDPHLFEALKIVFDSVEISDFDIASNQTTDAFDVENLVVVDTGNGVLLKHLIDTYNPKNLIVAVSRWEDFVSSFNIIDWQKTFNHYQETSKLYPHRIGVLVSRIDDSNEALIKINNMDISSLDHTLLCFCSDSSPEAVKLVKGLNSKTAQNVVNYLGFTQDEYNMVKTSTKKMQSVCNIYTPPLDSHHLSNVIVCASGPSLDDSIDSLRKLSETHFIIASASSYGTLRRNGIRVDVVSILERGYSDYDDYKTIIEECGPDDAILITSTVSDIRLHSLFNTVVTYFRVSLTPFALFSQHYNEHLPFDGPQAVNSSVSFALRFQPKSLLLVGVDLGTVNLSKVRSDGAVGVSPRDLKLTTKSNLSPDHEAYTDTYMTDARIILEQLSKSFKPEVKLFNSSNGVLIDGFEPIDIESYINSKIYLDSSTDDLSKSYYNIKKWLRHCRVSTNEDFYALWHRGGQRLSIRKSMDSLRQVLKGSTGTFTEAEYHQISKIFSVNQQKRDQFAPRITRGCFLKMLCALKRQSIIMAGVPEKRDIFFDSVRDKTLDFIDKFEHELYDLCSTVEKDFLSSDNADKAFDNSPLA